MIFGIFGIFFQITPRENVWSERIQKKTNYVRILQVAHGFASRGRTVTIKIRLYRRRVTLDAKKSPKTNTRTTQIRNKEKRTRHENPCRVRFSSSIPFPLCLFLSVLFQSLRHLTSTAFCACRRFSASSNISLEWASNTLDVISSSR